jgi:hypothetical protein
MTGTILLKLRKLSNAIPGKTKWIKETTDEWIGKLREKLNVIDFMEAQDFPKEAMEAVMKGKEWRHEPVHPWNTVYIPWYDDDTGVWREEYVGIGYYYHPEEGLHVLEYVFECGDWQIYDNGIIGDPDVNVEELEKELIAKAEEGYAQYTEYLKTLHNKGTDKEGSK